MTRRLRFASYLAPNLYPVYEFVSRYVGEQLDLTTGLVVGSRYDELPGLADVVFLCGLAYVEINRDGPVLEALAAPVLQGGRYGGRPVYFSDVIVRRDSPWQSFADLRGRSWAYNEPLSHSGYGAPRYRLVQLGETRGYFGRVLQSGWHDESIRLVCSGAIDASAIDSQVLAVTFRDRPELASRLRVIDTLGPATIQPVAADARLPAALKEAIREVLVRMGDDPGAREQLARGFVGRFAAVDDTGYEDIRAMRGACEAAGFLTLL
jgi:phosphonate transport system substrate-binding protein